MPQRHEDTKKTRASGTKGTATALAMLGASVAVMCMAHGVAAATSTPRVINLGRTSRTCVGAARPDADNKFHGVANAFDDGNNWIDRINYTYYGGIGRAESIYVLFDVPATVVSIGAENAPPFTYQIITCDNGSEGENEEETDQKKDGPLPAKSWRLMPQESPGTVPFDPPRAQVKAVRLDFTPVIPPFNFVSAQGQVMASAIYEIRILGWFPSGTVYTVQKPHVLSNIHTMVANAAQPASAAWSTVEAKSVTKPAPSPAVTSDKIINLGRTSRAAVTASEANGDRPVDDIYHGVANAFDGGTNRHNNRTYSSWQGGRRGGYIEVQFDVPATVTAIETEKSQPFSCKIIDDAGSELFLPASAAVVQEGTARTLSMPGVAMQSRPARPVMPLSCTHTCMPPLANVRSVRVMFEDMPTTNVTPFATPRADEVKIMGWFPDGTNCTVQKPRVFLLPHHHLVKADLAFTEWRMDTSAKTPLMQETDTHLIYTYSMHGVPMMRVKVDKKTGTSATEAITPEKPVLPGLSEEERDRLLPDIQGR